jgi:hypothetical protein
VIFILRRAGGHLSFPNLIRRFAVLSALVIDVALFIAPRSQRGVITPTTYTVTVTRIDVTAAMEPFNYGVGSTPGGNDYWTGGEQDVTLSMNPLQSEPPPVAAAQQPCFSRLSSRLSG